MIEKEYLNGTKEQTIVSGANDKELNEKLKLEANKAMIDKAIKSFSINKKIGRNEPCPCGAKKADGSPIKFKKCCIYKSV